MRGKEIRSTCITCALIVALTFIIGATVEKMIAYYKGPKYVIDKYIEALNDYNYEAVYKMLDKSTISKVGGKEAIINYYKKIYNKEKRLRFVKVDSQKDTSHYEVSFFYEYGNEKQPIELVKNHSRWQVAFPFQFNEVTVYAPFGCEVSLENYKLDYQSGGMYSNENVLPGTYLLVVNFPMETYNPYYEVVHISKDTRVVLDYPVGNMKIEAPPGTIISVNDFQKKNIGGKVTLTDLLAGNYTIKVTDPMGNMDEQIVDCTLQQENKNIILKDFKLTEEGIKRREAFLEHFYKDYEKAITEKNKEILSIYFETAHQKRMLQQFADWYIEKKHISDANLTVQYGTSEIDKNGRLHQKVTESAILYNQEKNERGKEIVKPYKVIISWDICLCMDKENWKIENRSIVESIVAVKDQEGRWVQY